ncbi:3-isopropylmalate dehydrogenase [Candidatus Omnitrophus magneticus]|uniref:3-isopropylmalate dehydrogenase n=1 Tax=Candidatus Omnitrophus magneticus TaxID=1609969 RepID=A0A0F0CN81_9BACT|nr:3-isopropylmalate dehydrogenase [Candidatus Omnitrophus magneticus]
MYKIAVIPGDGTGPEVIREGCKVLSAVSNKMGFKLEFTKFDLSGERYLKTGALLLDEELEELKKYDAIYFGAIGHPDIKPGILERGVLLKLRFELDQYINLRPVKLYPNVYTPIKDKGPNDIDFVVVRENTEGLYTGTGGIMKKGTPDEVAIQTSINTRKGVERCIRFAYEYTRKRDKKKRLTLCGKTNVLTYAFDLWDRVFNEIGKKYYPEIERDYVHVDALTLYMIEKPEFYDVIVTDNMFGDIITDLAAIIQGGLGIASGGNLNPEGLSMFEPIGGTAPKHTGKNEINPLAAIGSGAMMLDFLGEEKAAKAIEAAIIKVTPKMKSMRAAEMGYTTQEVGDLVVKEL